MTMAAAVELRGVRKRLGAMEARFSFARRRGSVTAVMGASGSGKSTLLNLVAGFLAPDRGQVLIDGRDVTGLPPAERGLSMVFQDNNLFAHLDVRTNVGLGMDPALKLDAEGKKRVEAALERVGLGGFGRRMPGTLSGGERQRVALARAFARARPLLLLDEPFDGLGPGLAEEMLGLMLEIRKEVGATVLMVTHDPEEARRAADTVLFIDRGSILADQPLEGFLERRDIPALNAYLGANG